MTTLADEIGRYVGPVNQYCPLTLIIMLSDVEDTLSSEAREWVEEHGRYGVAGDMAVYYFDLDNPAAPREWFDNK